MNNNTTYHDERVRFVDFLYSGPLMMPRRYVFILTNRCNLSCAFCPQSKKKLADAMTATDWISLLDQLPEYATITITGGEPLLFPDFETVFNHIVERFPCNIITNGMLLDAEILNKLLKHDQLKVLSLSIDDIGNKCRGMQPGQWERLVENTRSLREVRDLLESNVIFDIKTVVLDENAASLAEIHRFCMEELKCDTHSFQYLKGSPFQHADSMVDFDAVTDVEQNRECYSSWEIICEQMELVRKYNQIAGTSCYSHPRIFDLNSAHRIDRQNAALFNQEQLAINAFNHCKAPWESVHVNADGMLFPCLSVGMGDVRKQSLKSIVFSDKFESFRLNLRKKGLFPACRRCGYLQVTQEGPK